MIDWGEVVCLYACNICDQAVESKGSQGGDHYFAQKHNNFSNSGDNCVSEGVGPYELESILCCIAEVLSSQGDLDVCGFIDELDDSFNAGQAASEAVDHVFEAFSVGCT